MKTNPNILILNGPNLQLLGQREPEIYGTTSLADIEATLRAELPAGATVEFRQSNYEGELVTWIGELLAGDFDALIINPAAYTHTSVALADAISAIAPQVYCVELHISNVHQREAFRHKSFTAASCHAQVMGFGVTGYSIALKAVLQKLAEKE